jgi:dGTPase
VVDKEIAGYGVINTLLNTYTNAVNNSFNNTASNYDTLIIKGLPKTVKTNNSSLYSRLSSVCYYVSLLSDSKAILDYKKIKGISF